MSENTLSCHEAKQFPNNDLQEAIVIRSISAGVFIGTCVKKTGKEVILQNAKKLQGSKAFEKSIDFYSLASCWYKGEDWDDLNLDFEVSNYISIIVIQDVIEIFPLSGYINFILFNPNDADFEEREREERSEAFRIEQEEIQRQINYKRKKEEEMYPFGKPEINRNREATN